MRWIRELIHSRIDRLGPQLELAADFCPAIGWKKSAALLENSLQLQQAFLHRQAAAVAAERPAAA